MIAFGLENLDLTQSGLVSALKAGAFGGLASFVLFTLYARWAFDWVFGGVPAFDKTHRWGAALALLLSVVLFWGRQPATHWVWLSLYLLPGLVVAEAVAILQTGHVEKWLRADPAKSWLACAAVALAESIFYAWFCFFSVLNGSMRSVFKFYPFIGASPAL